MIPHLLPVLLVLQPAPLPGAVEIQPGLFIVKGAPGPETFAALKAAGITHVLSLRNPSEGDFTADAAATRAAGADYGTCPVDREPTDAALEAFRTRLKALPKGARVLVHCASGNRAAGALFTHWVLDLGMDEAQALALAHQAGLHSPVTESAVKAHVAKARPLLP